MSKEDGGGRAEVAKAMRSGCLHEIVHQSTARPGQHDSHDLFRHQQALKSS